MTETDKLIADLEEPRSGIHDDGTEELKSWDDLWEQCQRAAKALRASPPEAEERLAEALEILHAIEFTTAVVAKCPVCLGFEKDGNGETSRHHNATCRLDALLKRCDRSEGKE